MDPKTKIYGPREREVTKGKTFDDVTKSQRTKTKALEMSLKTSFG